MAGQILAPGSSTAEEVAMKKPHTSAETVRWDATREGVSDEELRHVSGAGISLTYGRITWTYVKQKPDGTAAGNVAAK